MIPAVIKLGQSEHDGPPDFCAEETNGWIVYPWELREHQS